MSISGLSVCMIVKNEQKFLPDCLESIRTVAEQIVVVDTGSTDKTVAIAEEFGAEVHHFEWIGDFAAARNESIKHATGEWILWLDADERLRQESIPELRKILKSEKKPTAYIIQIYNLLQDKKNYKISTGHRLFNNRKGIRFEGRIHEQVAYSISRLGGQEKKCNIALEHLGYGLDNAEQDKKNIRNRELLEKLVNEEPGNAYAHYTLAQHYSMTHALDRALEHYEIVLRKNDFQTGMKVSLLNAMAETCHLSGKTEQAIKLLNSSLELLPDQAGAYYMHYRIERDRKHHKKAIEWLLVLLDKNRLIRKNGSSLSTEVLLDDQQIYLSIATHFFELQDYRHALEWYSRLNNGELNQITVLEKMAISNIQTGNFRNAQLSLEKLNQCVPDSDHYQEWYGTVLIKNQKFAEAASVYALLLNRHPDNPDIKKRLAGLYAKSGDMDKAMEILSGI